MFIAVNLCGVIVFYYFQIRREFNLGNFDLEIHAMIICETGFMIKWRMSESKL